MQTFPALTQFDFHHALEERAGVSIAFFTSSSCASCAYWRQLLDTYRSRHPEVEVYEVDAKRDLALAEEFSIFHLPALFLYSNGTFHSEIQCEASLPKLEATIDEALAKPAQELP
jgi:thiol-disulfide isomerase/thioredoxin